MPNLNLENNIIEDVVLFYPKIKTASFKYQSQTEKEWAVTAIVDKKIKAAWNKAFPKQKVKEIEYDEFVEKHGAEYAISDEEQYVLTLKKAAQYQDKETKEFLPLPDKYRPRAFMDNGSGELVDITFTHLIGNGSKGVVQFEVNENSFGTFAKLAAIRVDDLVVVEQSGEGKFNVLGNVSQLAENPKAKEESKSGDTDNENQSDDDSIPF